MNPSLIGLIGYVQQLILDDVTFCDLNPETIIHEATQLLQGERELPIPRKLTINKMGTTKKRTLYIYADYDKLLMKVINQYINTLDLSLSPRCYAFQKRISIKGAIADIKRFKSDAYTCIKVDISNYFNTIPVNRLLTQLPPSLKDEPIICAFLTSVLLDKRVILDGKLCEDYEKGVMAGTPLGPTLANLYLTDFDNEMSLRCPFYARYSDDMLFFIEPDNKELLLKEINAGLKARGLTINQSKTKSIEAGDGWEFLGVCCNDGQIDLSTSSVKKMKDKIARTTRKLIRWKVRVQAEPERAIKATLRKIQYKFYGTPHDPKRFTWAQWYFPVITTTASLQEIDQYFQMKLRTIATGRHTKHNYKKVPYSQLKAWGYKPLVTAYYSHKKSDSV